MATEDDNEDRDDFRLLSMRRSPELLQLDQDKVWPLQLKTKQIERYVLGDIIGRGSYAEVRECIHVDSLERCAVKIVNKEYLRRQAPEALANQRQEIRLLRMLKHENIITLSEVIHRGSKIYLVLEHCTYVLSELLREQPGGRLCIPLAKNLFHQLSLGLSYLHSMGVVHRDIKPQNLLITNMGQIKIIDFGVSQILSAWNPKDDCKNHEGSPLFQAPELICGEQSHYSGYKVDVWSAGITLYLLLYGKCPFYDESLLGLYDRILVETFEIPNQLKLAQHQAVVTDLLGRMLDKSSRRRASIDEVLAHPWLSLALDEHRVCDGPDCADQHSELIHLAQADCGTEQKAEADEYQQQGKTLNVKQTSSRLVRDIYRSTSVLPYLHNLHFPNIRPTTPQSSHSILLGSISETDSSRSQISTSSTAPSSPDSQASNPHEVLDHLEWGTEQQFRLLKLPHVRANRLWLNRRPHLRRHSCHNVNNAGHSISRNHTTRRSRSI